MKGLIAIKVDVLDVKFDNIIMAEAIEKSLNAMTDRNAAYVVTPNPEIVMLCRADAALLEAVNSASLVLPDGIGVIKGARLLGTPLKEKIPGIEFAEYLLGSMAKRGMSVFLLGAKPGVSELAAKNLATCFDGLKIIGTNDGYFTDDTLVINKINATSPDLLIVCLGAPKQERWMQQYAPLLRVGLMVGLGGAMDVFAGVAERAPENWRRLNLEWLYRLKSNPHRARRMINLPKFVLAVIERRLFWK